MLLPYLQKDRLINEEESLCVLELSKLSVIDNKIYQMLLEKDNINVNEFYQIAFAFLDYGFFHLFIDFTIHYQELICKESIKFEQENLLCENKGIDEIIKKLKEIKEMNKIYL